MKKENLFPKIVTRYAPTPSGFLHLGNIYNFLYIYLFARQNDGEIQLRIDDIDRDRYRDQYLENIFETIDWLGIDYDVGPSSVDDFKRSFSQLKKIDYYRSYLDKLSNKYFCECSRSMIKKSNSSLIYSGVCREKQIVDGFGHYNSRIRVLADKQFFLESICFDIEKEVGDFVLWRKDDLPSYQFVSAIEDHANKINTIIRGKDLLSSTFMQTYILKSLDLDFSFPQYMHHHLLKENGEKLSKSALKAKILKPIDQFSRESVYCNFLNWLGIENSNKHLTLENLLEITSRKISDIELYQVSLREAN